MTPTIVNRVPVPADPPPPMEPVVVAESLPAEVVSSGEEAAPPAQQWMGERTRTVCAVVVALVAAGAALAYLKDVLTPLLIALFLYYLFKPLTDALGRARVPRVLSAPAVALVLLFALVAIGQGLYGSAVAVSDQLPDYKHRLVDRLDSMLVAMGYQPGEDGRVFNHDRLDAFLDGLWKDNAHALAGNVMGLVEVSLMAVFYLLFLFIEAQSLPRRVYQAFNPDTADDAQSMGQEVNDQVKRYLLYKTLVNLGMALTHGLICWGMGLHFGTIWAASMFLLNYITYVGSIVALAPPVLLALIQFDNPWLGLLLAGLLTANRLVWVDYIEIRYLGNVLNLSPLVMLLSIAFFGALWGPVGLLLAVPLMTSLKIVLAYYQTT
ncbi:MAG: AI-2E family transporter, partial [Gemmataceae bacterium]